MQGGELRDYLICQTLLKHDVDVLGGSKVMTFGEGGGWGGIVHGCSLALLHVSPQPPAFSPANDEQVLYRNDEAQKGSVNIPVPEWFRDLSLDHKPLGCLTEGVKVTRLVYHSVYHSVY